VGHTVVPAANFSNFDNTPIGPFQSTGFESAKASWQGAALE